MYPYTDGELDAFVLMQTGIEVPHRSKNSQPSPYCSLGVIFMSYRKTEVDQETIAKILGDIPIVALNNVGTHPLISTDDFSILFRVELGGEFRGVHQIAKHHGQLPSFRVRRRCSRERCDLQGGLLLSCKRWCWLRRLRACGRGFC